MKDARRKNGIGSYCRPCDLQRYKDRREAKREEIFVQRQGYRRRNAALVAERHRIYYEENREHLKEYAQKWAKDNPGNVKEGLHRRRASIAGSADKMPRGYWKILLKAYGEACMNPNCSGKNTTLSHDHVIPLSKGGEHSLENSQILCHSCNSAKHVKTFDYRPNGWQSLLVY